MCANVFEFKTASLKEKKKNTVQQVKLCFPGNASVFGTLSVGCHHTHMLLLESNCKIEAFLTVIWKTAQEQNLL